MRNALNERDTTDRYRQVLPPEHLRRFVKCFWFLRLPPSDRSVRHRIVPDGCSELVISLADPLSSVAGGHPTAGPSVRLIGQFTGPTDVASAGRLDIVGVRFWGAAVHHLFGLDAGELTNRRIELDDIAPALARECLDALRSADTLASRRRALFRTLTCHLPAERPAPSPVERAILAWRRSRGTLSVGDVCRRIGLSARQLERRFRTEVGIPPKRFARINRFQFALRALYAAPVGTWARVAYRCGYADQAHLIREFREFASTSPSGFLASGNQLSAFFNRALPNDTESAVAGPPIRDAGEGGRDVPRAAVPG